ncbi:MAG: hypothetical protein OCU22_02560 [Canidatus Methanoxibalbensis ujae]|nr:hypothetical protein [Candidatus Methanoxibalbensis ujae]RLG39226.1 MAG: V-type ATP synthase subunit F [Methanosarcinales archaeon]
MSVSGKKKKQMDGGDMIAAIVDEDTATGLRLAGIENIYELSEKDATAEDLSQILDKIVYDFAVIIITERFAEKIRAKIRSINEMKHGITPIIVEIPDRKGAMEKEIDEISLLIKRAVGIRLK